MSTFFPSTNMHASDLFVGTSPDGRKAMFRVRDGVGTVETFTGNRHDRRAKAREWHTAPIRKPK